MMAQARVAAARPSRHFARAFSSDVKMWSPDGDKLLNNDDMVAIITHNLERDQRKASEKVVPWYVRDQQDKTRNLSLASLPNHLSKPLAPTRYLDNMPPTYFNNISFEARSRILRSIAAVYDSPSKKTTVRGDGFTTFLRNERSRPGQLLDSLDSLSSEESESITRIMTFTTKDGSMVVQNFETEVCRVCYVLICRA